MEAAMTISKNDLLSIKNFSALTGIKQSTLRYYDDLGLFTPAERGENNYRYYSPQQIVTINSINLLHELNMPIRQITHIQSNRSPELMFEVLSEKESALEADFINVERSLNVVKTLKRLIQAGMAAEENVIETRYLEEMPVAIGPPNDFGDSEFFYDAFLRFCAEAKQYRIDLRLPVGGMFKDFGAFFDFPHKPANFFSVDPKGLDKRPAAKFLVAYHRGYYGETGTLAERMQAYLREQELTPVGPVYNIFLLDELSVDDPKNYLMQATVEVAPFR